ncbi:hypothetical protein AB0J83_20535 [Actinoplanes sp. NPDC049596]|uniref:hypothetical protein n=1 Tax=unclassified Actinoplanes TaxID=2626549 RepID=UPI003425F161
MLVRVHAASVNPVAVQSAGSIRRQGSNAELQVVNEHIVGHNPSTLDFAGPLTAI